jgi:hypothetical protein
MRHKSANRSRNQRQKDNKDRLSKDKSANNSANSKSKYPINKNNNKKDKRPPQFSDRYRNTSFISENNHLTKNPNFDEPDNYSFN